MGEMQHSLPEFSMRIFPASFPECSGTNVSWRVSVSTFQLPIIEQIALNQIYLHGLFFVIRLQSDYRIMTELFLKWWQTTWILLLMCSALASLMLLYRRHTAVRRAMLTCSGKMRTFALLCKNLMIKCINPRWINVWEMARQYSLSSCWLLDAAAELRTSVFHYKIIRKVFLESY